MKYKLLSTIENPEDLTKLDYRELELLCAEIREFFIEKVSANGGHLSSNLGVIELTVALHRSLRSPQDIILFDVGHQSYTHKLLTGRMEGFDRLRQRGGLSGFPCPDESCHDICIAGHGSAGVSQAVGLARAKKLMGQPGLVVVVVGDGAFTGGMTYEAINNVDALDNLVIILNDNSMSISKNVGALSHYLTQLRTSPQYYKAKEDVKQVLDHTPVIGDGMMRGIRSMKTVLRKSLYHSTFFEEMGLRYIGPIDGHDLPQLCGLFGSMRKLHKPLLIHVETKKGKGFKPAEKNPGAFHGVSSFDARHITDPDISPKNSFSTVFGQQLSKLADEDEKVCAITAAMKYGTGLQYMKKYHIRRFFDVGMAEEHAVTFAAGLAAGGMKPVVALYSTFMQRAYDQLIHDVMLCRRKVLFAIDRAGLVPGDGETHQGIYDAAYFSQQPDLPVISPSNYAETTYWLGKLIDECDGPAVLRYPRGEEPLVLAKIPCTGNMWDKVLKRKKAKVAIVSYGIETAQAIEASEQLLKAGVEADVYKMVQINPIDQALVDALCGYSVVLFAEEGMAAGGIGEHLLMAMFSKGFTGRYIHQAIQNIHIDHAQQEELLKETGLDGSSLAELVKKAVSEQ